MTRSSDPAVRQVPVVDSLLVYPGGADPAPNPSRVGQVMSMALEQDGRILSIDQAATPSTPGATCVLVLKYLSATYYTGATHYTFRSPDSLAVPNQPDAAMTVIVANDPAEPKPRVPADMLESGVVGGIPDANPALVGKAFRIAFDADGKVVSIELAGPAVLTRGRG